MTDDVEHAKQLAARIRALDPRTAQLTLVHLVTRLRNQLDEDEQESIRNSDDASELLHVVERAAGEANTQDPRDPSFDEAVTGLLLFAAEDPVARAVTEELIENPPANRQLSVSQIAGDPFVIGALVTLLQTRFRIRVKSDGNRRTYDVEFGKDAADVSAIGSLLKRFGGGA